jgi:hypothetical protein
MIMADALECTTDLVPRQNSDRLLPYSKRLSIYDKGRPGSQEEDTSWINVNAPCGSGQTAGKTARTLKSFEERAHWRSLLFFIQNDFIKEMIRPEAEIPTHSDPDIYFALIQSRFQSLAETWKRETRHLSNVTKKCTHPAYQQIIGMGEQAVEFILCDLKESKEDWFWALSAITGENPIAEEDAGNVSNMTEAWLQWGRAKNYKI